MTKRVTVYVKPGCHLCDDAEHEIEAVRKRVEFELDRVNIMSDPVLAVRYGFDIPVVFVDDTLFSTHFVDARKLEARLKEMDSYADPIERA